MIYGQECPGYADTFVWRSEKPNKRDPRKACKKKNGKDTGDVLCIRSKPEYSSNEHSHGDSNGSPSSSQGISTTPLPTRPIPYSLSSLEQQALGFFCHQHILPAEEGIPSGHLSHLPELYVQRWHSDCFQNAMLSVSYLTLFNSTGFKPLYIGARKYYGKAMVALRDALRCPVAVLEDATLASALMLSMFVVCKCQWIVARCYTDSARRIFPGNESNFTTPIRQEYMLWFTFEEGNSSAHLAEKLYLAGPSRSWFVVLSILRGPYAYTI